MPTDLANAVEIAHGILTGLGRSLEFLHVPAPKHHDDEAYSRLSPPSACPTAATSTWI